MARKIIHQLVDDLDGTVLEENAGETLHFSIEGVAYEIDLSDANAQALRDALSPFIAAARRTGSAERSSSSAAAAPRKRRRPGQQDYSDIRQWAKESGIPVSERGRVPASVIEAYEAAH